LLIIGATSAIAHAVARRYAARGARLYLIARNLSSLTSNGNDLQARGATGVQTATLDVNDIAQHEAMVAEAFAAYGGFDAVLLAFGVLPDQAACESSVEAALSSF